ncbi:MAG: SusD/RagB family nutrient-binding outer membrane lipoprotein, partial [Tannerellaceae bacterium]|nr:SusD/RagB family nutrient-binding outer membrane lipoprotein [Tannerellaceae bacterium]
MKHIYTLALLITALSCTSPFEGYNTDNTGFTDTLQDFDFNKYGLPMLVVQQGIYFNHDWGGGKNWTFQVMQNLSADMFCGYMHSYNPFVAGLSNTVYNLNDGWNGTMWENTYGYIMTEVKKAEDLNREALPVFYAITKILKVELMHRV